MTAVGRSQSPPKVKDPDAAGEAAMAAAEELRQGEEIARKKKAESSRDLPSRFMRQKALECSGTGWLLRAAYPAFKYQGPYNGQIRNQRPDLLGLEIRGRAGGVNGNFLFPVAPDNSAPLSAATDPRGV